MTTLNSVLQSRLVLGSTLFSMAVMLAACGGGADEGSATASEAAQALASGATSVATDGADAAAESLSGGRAPLADWETQDDPATSQAFLASQLAKAPSMERALA